MKAAALALAVLVAALVAWLALQSAPEGPTAASSAPRAASPASAGEPARAELTAVAAAELALESGPARSLTAEPELPPLPEGLRVRRVEQLAEGGNHYMTALVLHPSGAPLSGCTVRLQWGDVQREQRTDARGLAELGPVGTGTSVLSLDPGDLPPQVVPPIDRGLANHLRVSVPVDSGRPVVLRTAWAGSIYGLVTGPEGTPARDVTVVLETPTGGVEHRLEARTDADGAFEVGGVHALDYTLGVDATSPGASGLAPPAPRRVSGLAGAAVGAGTLVLGAGEASVEGRLVDAEGAPAAGVKVELERAERPGIWGAPGGAGAAVSGDDGRYRVRGLSGGVLRLRTGGMARGAEVVLELGHDEQLVLEDLTVELPRRRPATELSREQREALRRGLGSGDLTLEQLRELERLGYFGD